MIKKCLTCDTQIDRWDHYLCTKCYTKIKKVKSTYIYCEKEYLKTIFKKEFKINKNIFSLENNDKNSIMKAIATAEILNEKWNDDQFQKEILNFSNGIKPINYEEKIIENQKNEEIEKSGQDDEFENREDYRKKHPTNKRCKDGHYVRSWSEAAIDNFFMIII